MDGSLRDYEDIRDLDRTPEPGGEAEQDLERPIFVIQEHDASTHHWDLRLEIEGVLKSWSIPRGPVPDPSEKRWAIPTEDHPLAYAEFEGVIPEDEYGGGAVIIWDRGTWSGLKDDEDGNEVPLADQLDDGHSVFRLHGDKLTGGWALQRFESDEDEPRWLLVKMDDDAADARRNPVSTEPRSVVSGRTVDEVAREEAPAEEATGETAAGENSS